MLRRVYLWFAPAGVPLAWRQLVCDRNRLLASLLGIIFTVSSFLFVAGSNNALFESVALVYRSVEADLVLQSVDYESFMWHTPFARDRLVALLGDRGVAEVEGLRTRLGRWRAHDGVQREILVIGVEPTGRAFTAGVGDQVSLLRRSDALLYDTTSLPSFGRIATEFARHGSAEAELNGQRFVVRGLFSIGISFAASGQVMVGHGGFHRLFPDFPDFGMSLGLIRLRPGANAEAVQARLRPLLDSALRIKTKAELIRAEQHYWNARSPVGFVIPATLVVVVVVGAVVFYQILYNDVQTHLAEYATLKAIGFADADLERVVLQQSMFLALLGFPIGAVLAWGLFAVATAVTHLPWVLTPGQLGVAFCMTAGMCLSAGIMALRTLYRAQPAEVFG